MLTIQLQPKSFSDLVGCEDAVELLHACVVSNNRPVSYIFYGAYGSGKTSAARIFCRAILCPNSIGGEPCDLCVSCTTPETSLFTRYDPSQLATRVDIDLFKSTVSHNLGTERCIVIDEAHLIPPVCQAAMLAVLDDVSTSVVVIFTTTRYEDILEQVRSRSLSVYFGRKNNNQVEHHLKTTFPDLTPAVRQRIINVSQGIMRNCHNEVDRVHLVGEIAYLAGTIDSAACITQYILSLLKRDRVMLFSALEDLCTIPLPILKEEYQHYLYNMLKDSFNIDVKNLEESFKKDIRICIILKLQSERKLLGLIKSLSSQWIMESFNSYYALQTSLLAVYQLLES